MSEALIRKIAQQIVREQLLQNWVFYPVLLAVLIVGVVALAFIGSYIRKCGEFELGLLEIQQKLLAAQNDLAVRQVVFDAALPYIRIRHQKLRAAVSAFEAKAPTLMKDIVGV